MTHCYSGTLNLQFLCLSVMFVSLHIPNCFCKKIPLYVGGLQELTDLPDWYEKVKLFPYIINYALDMIRNRTDILTEYELQLIVKDVKFSGGLGSKALVHLLEEEPKKCAILGPVHTSILQFSGQIAALYNIAEIFYGEASSNTADTQLYPTLFKVNQWINDLNHLRIRMMKYFGWVRVGTLALEGDLWELQINHFHDLLDQNNMTLVSTAVIKMSASVRDIITNFKQLDVRIFMFAAIAEVARNIFCEAYKQGLYGDSYVWVLSGPTIFGQNIVADADENEMTCTKKELIIATEGQIILNYDKFSKSEEPTVSGKTPQEVMKDIMHLNSKTQYEIDVHVGVVHDSVWVLALGLNNSLKYLEEKELKLHEYNYTEPYLDCVMKGLSEVEFMGASGLVAFDERGHRIGITKIQIISNNTHTNIAVYDKRKNNLTWLVPVNTIWHGKKIPGDSFIYVKRPVSVSYLAFGLVVASDVIACIMSAAFLSFNIYNRNQKFIKLSSPMLNNVILGGSFLLYVEVLIDAIDYVDMSKGDNMCMGTVWLISVGFTAIFGALFAKTYRVYVIFRNKNMRMKIIKDLHLFGIITAMLMVDLFILIPWSLAEPLIKYRHLGTQTQLNNNLISVDVIYFCHQEHQQYWIAALYVYKGLMLAFGMFLAWETRHVNVPALNDSKYIGACIYNVVIACIFGVPLAHALPVDQTTLAFVLQCCLILFCTVICLCIIFVPKIQARNQIHSRFVTEQMTNRTMTIAGPTTSDIRPSVATVDTSNADKTVDDLREENRKLRMDIARETIAIAKLRKSLIEMTGNIHFYRSGPDYILFRASKSSVSHVHTPEKSSYKEI